MLRQLQPELTAPSAFAAVVEALSALVIPQIFGAELGAEIQGGGRGGPTHWSLLRARLFEEAANGRLDGPILALLPSGTSWSNLFAVRQSA